MFFSTYVLTKKGPLAKVWLAAHWEKKLTRNEVRLIDLKKTILYIVRPVVPIALRTSGELLVGVVRIYALKVKHLLKEATEATYFLRVSALMMKNNGKSVDELARRGHKSEVEAVTLGLQGSKQLLLTQFASGNAIKGNNNNNNLTIAEQANNNNTNGADNASSTLPNSRFASLAELINSTRFTHNSHDGANDDKLSGKEEDNVNLATWYTMQPTSQNYNGEENAFSATQQEYDEIAKMRADLMAFGARAPSSSTSKSKSSLSSMEKGRGSTLDQAAMTLNHPSHGNWDYMHHVPYPDVLGANQFNPDELDIGVPLPDDMTTSFPFFSDNNVQGAIGSLQLQQQQQEAEVNNGNAHSQIAPRARRNANIANNLVDLETTTLSREVVEENMQNRRDIVESLPFSRHGPWNEAEINDRTLTALCNNTNALQQSSTMAIVMHAIGVDNNSTSNNNNNINMNKNNVILNDFVTLARVHALNTFATSPLLCNVFESALAHNIGATANKYSRLLNSSTSTRNAQQQQQQQQRHDSLLLEQDDIPAGEEGNGELSTRKRLRGEEGNDDYLQAIDAGQNTSEIWTMNNRDDKQNRDRVGQDKMTMLLSSGAIQTLERVKVVIERNSATNTKRTRTEKKPTLSTSQLSSCTLREVCTGLRRREAAKTFVNILALASQQMIKAEQCLPENAKLSRLNKTVPANYANVQDIVLTLRDNTTCARLPVLVA